MGWWNKVTDFFGYEWVRARDDKGRYLADDKETPFVDESKKKVYKSRVKTNGIKKTRDTKKSTKKRKSNKKDMLKGDSQ